MLPGGSGTPDFVQRLADGLQQSLGISETEARDAAQQLYDGLQPEPGEGQQGVDPANVDRNALDPFSAGPDSNGNVPNNPDNRVNWARDQYRNHVDDWAGWPDGPLGRIYNPLTPNWRCNEFVQAAHVLGDPNATNYPTAQHGGYTIPTAADLANKDFAADRLVYFDSTANVQPGDIVVWYGPDDNGNLRHHTALYIGKDPVTGDDLVMYQQADAGLKINTIPNTTSILGNVPPIVRRYKY